MTTVRCTIEMELVYGEHFFPDSDDEEIILDSAAEAFVERLREAIDGINGWTLDRDSWVQAKIVDDVT